MFLGWEHQIAPPDRFSRKGYTLLINTWKRNDLLKQSISHYASCPGLDSIHIVWSEPDPPSSPLINFLTRAIRSKARDGHQIELAFDINKEDSLNNRFKEIKNLKTDAVFSIDDDIIFPCSSVEFAFTVWRSAPDTMVGFVPRIHWIDQSKGSKDNYIYGGWWSVWWMGTYSMVLSKAAFFHKKYLSLYTNEMPASIREYVANSRNCEDIAMSFLVANATSAPPYMGKSAFGSIKSLHLTLMKKDAIAAGAKTCYAFIPKGQKLKPVGYGKIFEIGSTGISSLGGHTEKRTECVNRFVSEFGRMPLVSTTVKAIDSRDTWFW